MQRCLQDEKKALLRLKGLAKMRDVIDKLVDATETVAPPHAKTPQDPEAPVATKPGKRIIRARSERRRAARAERSQPVAGRAVAELKRIFERADRDGSGDIDMLEFCKELRTSASTTRPTPRGSRCRRCATLRTRTTPRQRWTSTSSSTYCSATRNIESRISSRERTAQLSVPARVAAARRGLSRRVPPVRALSC